MIRPARVPACGPALIRKQGVLIDVSVDGKAPLPTALYQQLTRAMRYEHRQLLLGRAQYDPITGERHPVRVTTRRLYHYDRRGRLICGAGYIDRVYRTLRAAGYAAAFIDMTADQGHPARFAPAWDRLDDHGEFVPRPGDAQAVEQALQAGTVPETTAARRLIQRAVIDHAAGRIAKRLGGLYQLPPGVGKSHMFAAYPLLYPKAVIAFTAPDVDNVEKTVRHLSRYVPMVGQVGGGARSFQRVTVYTRDSLHHCLPGTDLLIVDEAHMYATDRVVDTLLRVAPGALRLAFTATPTGRIDGGDAELEPLFGPVVYRKTWPEATALGLIVPIEVRWIDCRFADNPVDGVKDFHRRKVLGIWRHEARHRAIAQAVRNHPAADQKLVMVATLEHALDLQRFLPEFALCYSGVDLARLQQLRRQGLVADDFTPIDAEVRRAMREDFEAGTLRAVIATDVWSQGVSFDSLPMICRADARSSVRLDEQIPGRVSRVHLPSGKAVGIVYDCDDAFDPTGFQRTAQARRRHYEENGWLQTQAQTPAAPAGSRPR